MSHTIEGTFGLDINPMKAAFNRAEGIATKAASNIGNRVKSFVTTPLAGIAAGISAFFTYEAFKGGIEGVIESGAELQKMHKITGIAVGSLATLKGVFKAADTPADNLGETMGRMQRQLFQATTAGGAAGTTIRALGLNLTNLGKAKPEEQFKAIGMAIAKLPSQASKANAAMSIFGRSGIELLPVFEELGNVDFGNLSAKAAILEKDAELFHKTSMAFRQARGQLNAVFVGMADAVAPTLLMVTKALSAKSALNFGLTLGNSIRDACQVLIGLGENPGLIWDSFGNYGIGTMATVANGFASGILGLGVMFVDAFGTALDIIGPLITTGLGGALLVLPGEMLKGLGQVLIYLQSGLEFAFLKSVDIFTHAIEGALAYLGAGLNMIVDKIREGIGSIPILGEKTGLKGFKGGSWQTHLAEQKEIGNNEAYTAPSFAEIKRRNIAKGVGNIGGDTISGLSGDMLSGSYDVITKSVKDFKKRFGNHLKGEITNNDFFGAAGFFDAAKASLHNAKASGAKALAPFGPAAGGAAAAAIYHPDLVGATGLRTGGLYTGGLDWGAYKQRPTLSHREQMSFENIAVAHGGTRAGTTDAAFNHVRSGDRARQRAAEKEAARKEAGQGTNNQLLADILAYIKNPD